MFASFPWYCEPRWILRSVMNKKILIGSVFAVVIIVLTSFTSVVGFQSTRHSSSISPLFGIRVKRAIDIDVQGGFTSNYLGKDKESTIAFPIRDNTTSILQRFKDMISGLSDIEFNRFVNMFVYKSRENNLVKEHEIPQIKQALYHIKDSPGILKYSGYDSDITFEACWSKKPICVFWDFIALLLNLIILFTVFLDNILE